MKRVVASLILASLFTSAFADEEKKAKCCKCERYASRHSTALSMMGWGVSIAVGIAALVCLIPNNEKAVTTTK